MSEAMADEPHIHDALMLRRPGPDELLVLNLNIPPSFEAEAAGNAYRSTAQHLQLMLGPRVMLAPVDTRLEPIRCPSCAEHAADAAVAMEAGAYKPPPGKVWRWGVLRMSADEIPPAGSGWEPFAVHGPPMSQSIWWRRRVAVDAPSEE